MLQLGLSVELQQGGWIMLRGSRNRVASRVRDALMVLTAISQLLVAVGFPLPAVSGSQAKTSDIPYPCQTRPCGCRISEECWRGDCCCFTLEQKLAWAREQEITPPEHAVRLAESRAARASRHGTCCSQNAGKAASNCCASDKPECPSCVRQDAAHQESDDRTIASDGGREASGRSFDLVIGIFALQCHGPPGAGMLAASPAIAPAIQIVSLDPPRCSVLIEIPETTLSLQHIRPVTPPPKAS